MGYDISIYSKNVEDVFNNLLFSISSNKAKLLEKGFDVDWFPNCAIKDMELKESFDHIEKATVKIDNEPDSNLKNLVITQLEHMMSICKKYPNYYWDIS